LPAVRASVTRVSAGTIVGRLTIARTSATYTYGCTAKIRKTCEYDFYYSYTFYY